MLGWLVNAWMSIIMAGSEREVVGRSLTSLGRLRDDGAVHGLDRQVPPDLGRLLGVWLRGQGAADDDYPVTLLALAQVVQPAAVLGRPSRDPDPLGVLRAHADRERELGLVRLDLHISP